MLKSTQRSVLSLLLPLALLHCSNDSNPTLASTDAGFAGSGGNNGNNSAADGSAAGSSATADSGSQGAVNSDGSTAGPGNGNADSGSNSPCGDTTDVSSFFQSNKDRQIPIVYEAGSKGPNDEYTTAGYLLDFAVIGQSLSVILVEPDHSTLPIAAFNASTDTFEDLQQEVNVMFYPQFGYNVIVQCTKATGAFTLVMTATNDATIFTRWVSE